MSTALHCFEVAKAGLRAEVCILYALNASEAISVFVVGGNTSICELV